MEKHPSGCSDLQVELPMSELSGFCCSEDEVKHSYKYKNLRAAFCNLPGSKEFGSKEFGSISTKVCKLVRIMWTFLYYTWPEYQISVFSALPPADRLPWIEMASLRYPMSSTSSRVQPSKWTPQQPGRLAEVPRCEGS